MVDLSEAWFHKESAALTRLAAVRWPDGPRCVHCGSRTVRPDSRRAGRYRCAACSRFFATTSGTPFERCRTPLTVLFRAVRLLWGTDTEPSAKDIGLQLGLPYKAAWRLTCRLHEAAAANLLPDVTGDLLRAERRERAASSVQELALPFLGPATARDVAQAAQVSISTVSRALSSEGSVHARTRERIVRVADRLGYKPNLIARMLTQRRRDTVGVLISDLKDFFWAEVLDDLVATLQEDGIRTFLFRVEAPNQVDEAIQNVLQYQVGAVITTYFAASPTAIRECVRCGVQVIVFNQQSGASEGALCISCDHGGGGRLAAETFLRNGRKRIAYIAGLSTKPNNSRRAEGFLRHLRAAGREVVAIEQGGTTYESGVEAAQKLLRRSERPDAIFCNNDMSALGVLDTARTVPGLQIPRDLEIIGFGDIPMTSWSMYQLSTIRQPVGKMIEAARSAIRRGVQGHRPESGLRLFAGQMIHRATTRAV